MATDQLSRKRLKTRTRIQQKALELFLEHGYQNTTLAEVADAADVALRTVTSHFPAKEELVFADLTQDYFSAESLAARVEGRPSGESTLDAIRDWMATSMAQATSAAGTDAAGLWRRRAERSHVIMQNEGLRARQRADYLRYEQVHAAGFGQDLRRPPDSLAPRLAALTVTAGLWELLELREAGARTPTSEHLLELVDRVLTFVAAGVDAVEALPEINIPPSQHRNIESVGS